MEDKPDKNCGVKSIKQSTFCWGGSSVCDTRQNLETRYYPVKKTLNPFLRVKSFLLFTFSISFIFLYIKFFYIMFENLYTLYLYHVYQTYRFFLISVPTFQI